MAKSKSTSRALAASPGYVVPASGGGPPPSLAVAAKPAPAAKAKPVGEQTHSNVLKHPYTAMMLDPLHASPTGRPDSAIGQTLTHRTRDMYDVVTNAAGAAALGIYPGITLSTFAATITAGTSTITAWATGVASKDDAEISAYPQARTLAMVVEYLPTASLMTESGLASLTPRNLVSGFPEIGALTLFQDDDAAVTAPATQALVYAGRPYDQPVFGANTTSTPRGYMASVVFTIVGAPASVTVGRIRVTRIIEVVPIVGTLTASAAKNHGSCTCILECVANACAAKGAQTASGENAESAWKSIAKAGAQALVAATKAYTTGDMSSLMSLLN